MPESSPIRNARLSDTVSLQVQDLIGRTTEAVLYQGLHGPGPRLDVSPVRPALYLF